MSKTKLEQNMTEIMNLPEDSKPILEVENEMRDITPNKDVEDDYEYVRKNLRVSGSDENTD
jgi:hypothetical protein